MSRERFSNPAQSRPAWAVDYSSLPHSKIQAFSIETAGHLRRDSELELYFSGLGKVRLEFSRNFNLSYVAKVIGWAIL